MICKTYWTDSFTWPNPNFGYKSPFEKIFSLECLFFNPSAEHYPFMNWNFYYLKYMILYLNYKVSTSFFDEKNIICYILWILRLPLVKSNLREKTKMSTNNMLTIRTIFSHLTFLAIALVETFSGGFGNISVSIKKHGFELVIQ